MATKISKIAQVKHIKTNYLPPNDVVLAGFRNQRQDNYKEEIGPKTQKASYANGVEAFCRKQSLASHLPYGFIS